MDKPYTDCQLVTSGVPAKSGKSSTWQGTQPDNGTENLTNWQGVL